MGEDGKLEEMGGVEGNGSIASASQNSCNGDAQNNSIQDNAHSTVELIRRRSFAPTEPGVSVPKVIIQPQR